MPFCQKPLAVNVGKDLFKSAESKDIHECCLEVTDTSSPEAKYDCEQNKPVYDYANENGTGCEILDQKSNSEHCLTQTYKSDHDLEVEKHEIESTVILSQESNDHQTADPSLPTSAASDSARDLSPVSYDSHFVLLLNLVYEITNTTSKLFVLVYHCYFYALNIS